MVRSCDSGSWYLHLLFWNPEHVELADVPEYLLDSLEYLLGRFPKEWKVITCSVACRKNNLLLGKSNTWFSNLCVLWTACCSSYSCTEAVFCSQLKPIRFQPGDHSDHGDFASGGLQAQSLMFILVGTVMVLIIVGHTGFSNAILPLQKWKQTWSTPDH